MTIKMIDKDEVEKLYSFLSEHFAIPFPDYAVFELNFKELPGTKFVVPDYKQVSGNLNYLDYPLLLTPNASTYFGKFNVFILQINRCNKIEVITAIHEFIHYKNKLKETPYSEDETEEEAINLMKQFREEIDRLGNKNMDKKSA